jgi:hypothetical protein
MLAIHVLNKIQFVGQTQLEVWYLGTFLHNFVPCSTAKC